MPPTKDTDSLVMSYLDLRKSLGVIGIALPFVLVFGRMLLQAPRILDSISEYYYSVMGDVFVGSLCAIAVFLFSYRGYERTDWIAAKIASIAALGVALFPTAPSINATLQQMIIGGFHFAFAIVFLLSLAFFSLMLFRKTDSTKAPTPQKIQRNTIYTVCGYIILACIAGIVIVELLPRDTSLWQYMPIFWLEAIAIESFGISWLIKGEAILKDENTFFASS